MNWTQQLAAAAGWHGEAVPDFAWDGVEQKLGVELPADYKDFSATFGTAEFDDWLRVIAAQIPEELATLRAAGAGYADVLQPYRLLTDRTGLVPWGNSEQGDRFYWLADNGPPDQWPVLAQDDGIRWRRYDMTMSEFCCRLLTEDDFDFCIAAQFGPPVIYPTV